MQLEYKLLVPLSLLIFLVLAVWAQSEDYCEVNNDCDIEDENLIVEISNGALRGKDHGYFYSYESIPYAEPPVGALRFEVPKPYTSKWNGVFDATRPPVVCMQWDQFAEGDDKLRGVEDCLTVNIYKPKLNGTQSKQLPVIIYIHGGAFMFGSPLDYSAEHFMSSGRVMVVKLTYRLGPLGFLSTEDTVIPGNFGLKDQRLALEWIKDNIGHFGGDPDQMIVTGFSAGAASVHLQSFQPNFTKYAKAAGLFSASVLNPWVIKRHARARAFALAKDMNCTNVETSEAVKECLKSKPAEDIVRGVKKFKIFGYNPCTTFGPVIEVSEAEGAFLTRSPEEIISAGDFAKVPLLFSYTADEGGYSAAELLQKMPRGEEMLEELRERWFDLAPYIFFYKDHIQSVEELDRRSLELKQRYLGDKEISMSTYFDLQRLYTDVFFKNDIERAVRLHRKHSSSPVYVYRYDNPADMGIGTALSKRNDINFGTVHGDDFFLIFRHPARPIALRADEEIVSKNFIKMLEDFVENPNELIYGSCKFVDNVGQNHLHLMHIGKESCESKPVHSFP